MSDVPVRVLISLAEGKFEIEGDAAFVERQLDRFDELLKAWTDRREPAKNSIPIASPGASAQTENSEQGERLAKKQNSKTLDHYDHLFALADEKIQILKDIPGSTASEKMVAVGLLLAYGNALAGEDTTTFDEIRDTCKAHGCLDATNFSKRLKDQREIFVFGGGPKSQTLKLTVPGRKRAEQLADELQAQ